MDLRAAQRIGLAAQGFADPAPKRVTVRHFRRALERMLILQLDSVNVVTRSHFLPMLARLGPYDPDKLDAWLWRSGENMEYLAHEASITSARLLPLLAHRFESDHWRAAHKFRDDEPHYIDGVLAEVAERGPLRVSDLSDPGKRHGPWWGNPKGKVALVSLYSAGRLAVADRDKNFTTCYDVPENVLPRRTARAPPPCSKDEAERELLLLGARALGIGTVADIADYFRLRMPAARPLLAELVADGELIEVRGHRVGRAGLSAPGCEATSLDRCLRPAQPLRPGGLVPPPRRASVRFPLPDRDLCPGGRTGPRLLRAPVPARPGTRGQNRSESRPQGGGVAGSGGLRRTGP